MNAKADITLNDDHRGFPLHDAAEHGHFEVCLILVIIRVVIIHGSGDSVVHGLTVTISLNYYKSKVTSSSTAVGNVSAIVIFKKNHGRTLPSAF